MNPLHMAMVSSIIGRKRRCPACGKEQVMGRPTLTGGYKCKKCGHHFSKKEVHPKHSSHP